MSVRNGLFSSESVSEGHPDKLADRISDRVQVIIRAPGGLIFKRRRHTTTQAVNTRPQSIRPIRLIDAWIFLVSVFL